MSNIAYIYQTKHIENEAWVAVRDQEGTKENYFVVMCDGKLNGGYTYDASKTKDFATYDNHGCICYRIPMSEVTKITELKNIENPVIKDTVIKYQKKWIRGTAYKKQRPMKNIPDWYIGTETDIKQLCK